MSKNAAEISDILDIRDLALRYAQNVDGRNGPGLSELFIEDGVIDGSGYFTKGRKHIAAIPRMLDTRYEATFHAVHNHLIELDGDRASGEVYATSHHLRKEVDDRLVDYVMIMRYHDQYVRQADGWRFAHRHILLEWTETRPAAPPAVTPVRRRAATTTPAG
jgi:hypothetical protein